MQAYIILAGDYMHVPSVSFEEEDVKNTEIWELFFHMWNCTVKLQMEIFLYISGRIVGTIQNQ